MARGLNRGFIVKINIDKLYQQAMDAFKHAHAPYSKFPVGACILSDGQYYAGCNVENASYPLGQCAEATAIGNMASQGGRKIEAILVLSDTPNLIWPCGGCLQKISEFCTADTQVISSNLLGQRQQMAMSELYPQQFSAKDLRA
jgi:cytidine deaminase